MQWFKSAMVLSTVFGVAAISSASGCSGGGKTPDGGGSDAPVGDVIGPDKKPIGDGSGGDGGCGVVACEVCDVSGFTPTPQGKPIGPHANKCSPTDLQAFVTACLGSSKSQTNCNAWQTAASKNDAGGAACLSCTFTQKSTTSWGVLACDTAGCSLNVPGCLDLALGQTAQESTTSTPASCGDFLSATYGCQDAACATCSTADFSTCDQDALAKQCKPSSDAFTNASSCAVLQTDAAPAAVNNCFPASTTGYTDTEILNFANFFCGQ